VGEASAKGESFLIMPARSGRRPERNLTMAQNAPAQASPSLPASRRDMLLVQHQRERMPRFDRLWQYYRNELRQAQPDPAGYQPAQARGLPARLRGQGAAPVNGQPDREVVVENDIAWRIHTLVDFMFGRQLAIQSQAADPERARKIERFLHAAFDQAGGVSFFQDLALLGAVYGFVDVLVRVADAGAAGSMGRRTDESGDPAVLARRMQLEPIEAPRAVPAINSEDYRQLDAYLIHWRQQTANPARQGLLQRVRERVLGGQTTPWETKQRTEVFTAGQHEQYQSAENAVQQSQQLMHTQPNRLGQIPVVHIQNLPQPYFYEGLSEVEPLIPLQDELNTRLSDRANRVTFQSFKMYLGKGIEGFTERAVGPGQMWSTDNPEASIQEFGGDGANPSEDAHINEVREAMDKTSAVPPVAAGLVRDKVGNLTSENALRVTLMGLLARTQKKRVTYGQGIQRICALLLHAADVHGIFPNRPSERQVRLDWPDPLPESETARLQNARRKLELGVPRKQVLTELGYPEVE
jgi:hypothetical protein